MRTVARLVFTLVLLVCAVEAHTQDATTGSIMGTVTEASTLRPIPGAQVSVAATGIGTLTDSRGRFQLLNVPPGQVAVRAQMIGYSRSEQTVNVSANQATTVDFELASEVLSLDEVVVTGTAGQARRREVGNSIGQIEVGQNSPPGASVEDLLTSEVPGVTVLQSSGQTGSGGQIRLRGNVSVSQSNQPLVYIDGVRVQSEAYPRIRQRGGSNFSGNNDVPSPLGDINPADIERIEVIKGAAATTLYGTEAAAGVIQIFTRRGLTDQPSMTFTTDQTWNTVQPFGPPNEPYFRLDPWLRTGWDQRYTGSVSGTSGEGFNYFLSGSLENNSGVLPDEAQDKTIVRGNFGFSPHSTLRLDWNTSFIRDDLSNAPQGNTAMGITLNAYRGSANYFGTEDVDVISEVFDAEINRKTARFITGLTAQFTPFERLSNRLVLGVDRTSSEMRMLQPYGFFITPDGVLTQLSWQNEMLSADYVSNLTVPMPSALSNTLSWGAQGTITSTAELGGSAFGLPGPGIPTFSSGATSVPYEERLRVINAGVFAQSLLGFRDRLFLTLGVRVDGNSSLGENLGLQSYPKASVSYVVSDESFWPEQWGQLKLRAAYGHAGRAPGAFDAVRTWRPEAWLGNVAFAPNQVGNPDLGPERTAESEVGFDAALFNGRLGINSSYYHQRTTGALFPVRQIPSNGFTSSQLENVGELVNQGFEVAVDATLVQSRNFVWDAGLSVFTNASEVTDLGDAPSFSVGSGGYIVEGQPAPVMRGWLITNPDELAEPEIQEDHYFGPNQPTHTIGLQTTLELPRGIRISSRGEYMGGHYINDAGSTQMATRGVWPVCEEEYQLLEAGRRNDLTALQRAHCDRAIFRGDMLTYPVDFFRLRELTLSLPVDFLIPRTTGAIFSLSARNYWTWKNDEFLAFDPEMVGQGGAHQLVRNIYEHVPPPSSLIASLRVNF